ncbi:MAG: gfo/Idh/MocA family oxidoreductase, partial [Eudoraea sp.]|nr:gfo/Idh/MocA family oxidoreductase [Eudoraea sp.]NNJ39462.1 gfo/Idh/MocA family oxidoreductase [Eudoraea sp.]
MKWTRRDVLKGLGGIPILGAVWWAGASNAVSKKRERSAILEQLNIEPSLPKAVKAIGGDPIRVGIIGFGIRGEQLCRALGYATEEWIAEMRIAHEEDPNNNRLQDFLDQDELNVDLVAVCDAFDIHAERAMKINPDKPLKRFTTHQEMIRSGEVD